MKHWTPIIFIALVTVLLASSAFAEIALIPGMKQANLSRNDSIGLQFQLKNLGNERACISLTAEHDDSYIDTHISDDEICLNESESTNVTITIRTENAPRGLQEVVLEAVSDQGDAVAAIDIYVSEEPEIELVAYPNDICTGKQETLNVLVRNNSDEFKEVTLQADNEMLLPYFERSSLSMMPFEERYVELNLHPSPSSTEGIHYVSMYAITDDETVKERVLVEVVNCTEEEEANFSVSMSSGCYSVEKGEPEKIYFRVENLDDEEQKVFFSVGGGLVSKLETSSAWLEEGEERSFYFEVNAQDDARVKDYDLTLHVWNNKHSVEKTVCVRPEKAHVTDVEVKENNLVVRECESTVFTLVLKNEGDYSEEFYLDIDNDYADVEAVLSSNRIEVERGEQKEVYISVNVFEGAAEGHYSITINIEARDQDFEEKLKFEVVEKGSDIELPSLEISSHTSSLKIIEGEEKSLFLIVKNNGETQISGISVELVGLPNGVSASRETNISLLPGQEKQFELTVKAEEATEGEYHPVLQAVSFEASDSKPFSLTIEAMEEEEPVEDQFLAGFVGLFAAGGSAMLGLLVLILVVLVIVFSSRAFRTSDTKNKKEAWIRG